MAVRGKQFTAPESGPATARRALPVTIAPTMIAMKLTVPKK